MFFIEEWVVGKLVEGVIRPIQEMRHTKVESLEQAVAAEGVAKPSLRGLLPTD